MPRVPVASGPEPAGPAGRVPGIDPAVAADVGRKEGDARDIDALAHPHTQSWSVAHIPEDNCVYMVK